MARSHSSRNNHEERQAKHDATYRQQLEAMRRALVAGDKLTGKRRKAEEETEETRVSKAARTSQFVAPVGDISLLPQVIEVPEVPSVAGKRRRGKKGETEKEMKLTRAKASLRKSLRKRMDETLRKYQNTFGPKRDQHKLALLQLYEEWVGGLKEPLPQEHQTQLPTIVRVEQKRLQEEDKKTKERLESLAYQAETMDRMMAMREREAEEKGEPMNESTSKEQQAAMDSRNQLEQQMAAFQSERESLAKRLEETRERTKRIEETQRQMEREKKEWETRKAELMKSMQEDIQKAIDSLPSEIHGIEMGVEDEDLTREHENKMKAAIDGIRLQMGALESPTLSIEDMDTLRRDSKEKTKLIIKENQEYKKKVKAYYDFQKKMAKEKASIEAIAQRMELEAKGPAPPSQEKIDAKKKDLESAAAKLDDLRKTWDIIEAQTPQQREGESAETYAERLKEFQESVKHVADAIRDQAKQVENLGHELKQNEYELDEYVKKQAAEQETLRAKAQSILNELAVPMTDEDRTLDEVVKTWRTARDQASKRVKQLDEEIKQLDQKGNDLTDAERAKKQSLLQRYVDAIETLREQQLGLQGVEKRYATVLEGLDETERMKREENRRRKEAMETNMQVDETPGQAVKRLQKELLQLEKEQKAIEAKREKLTKSIEEGKLPLHEVSTKEKVLALEDEYETTLTKIQEMKDLLEDRIRDMSTIYDEQARDLDFAVEELTAHDEYTNTARQIEADMKSPSQLRQDAAKRLKTQTEVLDKAKQKYEKLREESDRKPKTDEIMGKLREAAAEVEAAQEEVSKTQSMLQQHGELEQTHLKELKGRFNQDSNELLWKLVEIMREKEYDPKDEQSQYTLWPWKEIVEIFNRAMKIRVDVDKNGVEPREDQVVINLALKAKLKEIEENVKTTRDLGTINHDVNETRMKAYGKIDKTMVPPEDRKSLKIPISEWGSELESELGWRKTEGKFKVYAEDGAVLNWPVIQLAHRAKIEEMVKETSGDRSANYPIVSRMMQGILNDFTQVASNLNPEVEQQFNKKLQEDLQNILTASKNISRAVMRAEEGKLRPVITTEKLREFVLDPMSFSAADRQKDFLHTDLGLKLSTSRHLLAMVQNTILLRQKYIRQIYPNLNVRESRDAHLFDMLFTHAFPPEAVGTKLRLLRLMSPQERSKYKNRAFLKSMTMLNPDFDIDQMTDENFEVQLAFLNSKVETYMRNVCQGSGVAYETMLDDAAQIERTKYLIYTQLDPSDVEDPERKQMQSELQQKDGVPIADEDAGALMQASGMRLNSTWNPSTQNQITRDQIDDVKKQSYEREVGKFFTWTMEAAEDEPYVPLHTGAAKYFFGSPNYENMKSKFDSMRPLIPKDGVQNPSQVIEQALALYGPILRIKGRKTTDKDHPVMIQQEALEIQELVKAYTEYTTTSEPFYNHTPYAQQQQQQDVTAPDTSARDGPDMTSNLQPESTNDQEQDTLTKGLYPDFNRYYQEFGQGSGYKNQDWLKPSWG
jgi:hypothetical protein